MQYTTEVYNIYHVKITNTITNRIFDNYLIKVPEDELQSTEKRIHENYPNNTLKVVFTKRDPKNTNIIIWTQNN